MAEYLFFYYMREVKEVNLHKKPNIPTKAYRSRHAVQGIPVKAYRPRQAGGQGKPAKTYRPRQAGLFFYYMREVEEVNVQNRSSQKQQKKG
jgi:D-alanyl-D-alanine dipeptidase